MKITLEITNLSELEAVLALFKQLNLDSLVHIVTNTQPSIPSRDTSIDPMGLFGIWKDKPRTLEQIRDTSWKRNWDL